MYEVFEDYRDSDNTKVKNEIIQAFCNKIWTTPNERKVGEHSINYKVSKQFIGDVADVFRKYQDTKYISVNSFTSNKDSWHILRQKINNIYTNMCDGSVCLTKDYMDCIYTPRRLYFQFIKGKIFNPIDLENDICRAFEIGEKLYNKYSKQKMNINWGEYQKIINGFIKKLFNNYIPLDDFEDKNTLSVNITYWSEDNYIIKYIGKSLTGYMKDYQKKYYGISKGRNRKYKRCEVCGKLIEQSNNRVKYCKDCAAEKQLYWQRTSMKKSRENKM